MKQASDVESILLNEVDNEKYVYLYLEGDTWCAYERSAYYLAMEFPVVLDKEIVHDGYEVILMKASFNVDKMQLPLFRTAVLRTVADDRLLFQISRTVEGFVEWKEQQLRSLPA
ncbi:MULTISPECIES: hypothetical protein [Bacteroidales]|uniref:Uncharacterized protein n=2 Tax=Parabacteroides goldsteinii TaxID=328812 RepID=A0A0J6CIR1_9BACT|nr:hypothetical protein [Parabacteroides goldsteinii]KKB48709.1 hypothetical protein HMPREF1535_03938 [Parabacteroides goldsteinii DSM 19448 = WAL 12034]KMM33075.1 hypothetical protein ACM15_14085 [Parabacteroides goldsteinii]MBS6577789.1 hypothetical protein [Parabacteroides goldsteinii]MCS2425853.1 hypothetical protein [Parabacteroides goldsteinii]